MAPEAEKPFTLLKNRWYKKNDPLVAKNEQKKKLNSQDFQGDI